MKKNNRTILVSFIIPQAIDDIWSRQCCSVYIGKADIGSFERRLDAGCSQGLSGWERVGWLARLNGRRILSKLAAAAAAARAAAVSSGKGMAHNHNRVARIEVAIAVIV
ncbi:MAG: hypothetical protein M3R03_06860 [Pseudomonadota bacterium]|nr:hypothetical protein [Pseudomonadota bacterium]